MSPPPPTTQQDFPRGGAASSALTSLEFRDAAEKASKELFGEESEPVSTSKKGKKRSNKSDEKKTEKKIKISDADSAKISEKKVSIHPLTFKKLGPGFSLLGVVKTINELDIVVSLPHQMTGSISITEISDRLSAIVEKVAAQDQDDDDSDSGDKMDEDSDDDDSAKNLVLPSLSKLFRVGQALPCVTISAEKDTESTSSKRKIELSIKPERINANLDVAELCIGMNLAASVKSVEDHGYILSFGLKANTEGVHGFLNQKHATAFLHSLGQTQKGATLSVGQFVYCTIIGIDASKRTFSVSAEPSAIAKAVVPGSHTLSFPSLKPGLLIPTRVKSAVDNGGIVVSFMGLFDGNIELAHLGEKVGTGTDLDESFKSGSKLQARILYVDNQRKRVGFTIQKNLLAWSSIEAAQDLTAIENGTIFEGVSVSRVDGEVGLVLDVGVLKGYVHVTRVSDKETPQIDAANKHAPGTTHTVRVIGYDLCDNLLQLSMKPSILEATFVRREDVKPGMLVSAKVTKVEDFGVFADLTNGISALVPVAHLAEGIVSNPSKKFKIGSTIQARVLTSDVEKRRIALTLKKPLVDSDLPLLSCYDPSMIGSIVDGYIINIKDFGCIVGFYNEVRAICPRSELTAHKITNPSDVFSVGQVVKCRVLNVNAGEQKMTVSFKKAIASVAVNAVAGGPGSVGDVSAASVVAVLETYVLVTLKPSGVNAFLEKAHLSDFSAHADAIFAGIKKDQVLPSVVVYDSGKKVKVSMKHSLLSYASKQHGAVAVGDVIPGFVKKTTDTSVIVDYVDGSSISIKAQYLADRNISHPGSVYHPGQTVFTVVTRVAASKGDGSLKVEGASLKPSAFDDVGRRVQHDLAYMEGLFIEQEKLQTVGTKKSAAVDIAAFVSKFAIGSVVVVVVKQKAPAGFLVDVEKGAASGVLTVELGNTDVDVGQTISARIVDLDYTKKSLDLRVASAVTAVEGEDKKKKNKKKLEALDAEDE
ncbi:UNVERIFIED_CONTAM: Protein RRP5, partial [Siphonaria sp. JEL0065]